jgi:hypothetical protein
MSTGKTEPQVTLTACESERMAALEAALEYVINEVDGLNYVFRGVPLLDDPRVTEARFLLPQVRWKWVQKR